MRRRSGQKDDETAKPVESCKNRRVLQKPSSSVCENRRVLQNPSSSARTVEFCTTRRAVLDRFCRFVTLRSITDPTMLYFYGIDVRTPAFNHRPYTVVGRKGSVISAKKGERGIARNSSFFKPVLSDATATAWKIHDSDFRKEGHIEA